MSWDGTTLKFGFHHPSPVFLDTTAIPNPGDFGFVFKDASGVLPVQTLGLVDDDTRLAATFTRAATTSRMIEYALKGYPAGTKVIANQPRGCVRAGADFLLHFNQAF